MVYCPLKRFRCEPVILDIDRAIITALLTWLSYSLLRSKKKSIIEDDCYGKSSLEGRLIGKFERRKGRETSRDFTK